MEKKAREQIVLSEVQAVVCSADLLRKQLLQRPAWLKNRRLSLLLHDEVECAKITELAALTMHFECCVTAGDLNQTISENRKDPICVPAIDPQLAAMHPGSHVLGSVPVEYMDAPASQHLFDCANNVYLQDVHRYGESVIRLLVQIGLVNSNEASKWISVADHSTQVHLVTIKLDWQCVPRQCAVCSPLFSVLLTLAVAWLGNGDTECTVGIILFFRKSVEVMQKLVQSLTKAGRDVPISCVCGSWIFFVNAFADRSSPVESLSALLRRRRVRLLRMWCFLPFNEDIWTRLNQLDTAIRKLDVLLL